MPMNRADYPPNWEEISLRIRIERAGNKCETCGRENGMTYIYHPHTSKEDPWSPTDDPDYAKICREKGYKVVKIVLTVAHIGAPMADGSPGNKHDKMDVREENLKAECQRCHLKRDLNDHITNRRNGRNWRRDQTTLQL